MQMVTKHRVRVVLVLVLMAGLTRWSRHSAYGAELQGADRDKVEAFVRFIWRPLPESSDLSFLRRRLQKPMSREELSNGISMAWEMSPAAETGPQGDEREAALQKAVDDVIAGQERVKSSEERIRRMGELYRYDIAVKDDAGSYVPSETYINGTYLDDGNFESIHISHDLRKANRMLNSRTRFKQERIPYHLAIGFDNVFAIKLATKGVLGQMKFRDSWIPRAVLSESQLTGLLDGNSHLQFSVRTVKLDNQVFDCLSMYMSPYTRYPRTEFFVDPNDVTHVSRVKVFNAETGALLTRIESRDFDQTGDYRQLGIPGWYREEVYEEDGSVFFDEWDVTQVQTDHQISPEVFAFDPPEGYVAIVEYPDRMVVTQEDGQTTTHPVTPDAVEIRKSRTVRWLWVVNAFCVVAVILNLVIRWRRVARR